MNPHIQKLGLQPGFFRLHLLIDYQIEIIMNSLDINLEAVAYNKAVGTAYYSILKQAKALLAAIEQLECRYTLQREDRQLHEPGIIHEMINPIIYLRLEWANDELYHIHFGIEQANRIGQQSDITSAFIRLLYKATAREATTINIESCVKTDWFINSCSAMYEYIEERNRYHTFMLIKHKPVAAKRKQMQVVA